MNDFDYEGICMQLSDRRWAQRYCLTVPLYIREWKSPAPEQRVESLNVSECGVYFETDAPPRTGSMMHIRLEMPEQVTGNRAVEYRCIGKVMRVEQPGPLGRLRGVSVRFDYWEVSHATGPTPSQGTG
jgi:hypothetical protein